ITAKTAATIDPHKTASRPARPCSISEACAESPLLPTLRTSAQATPSGHGTSEVVTHPRRSGLVYMTPRIPPRPQIHNEPPNGNPVQSPANLKPGNTNMLADS